MSEIVFGTGGWRAVIGDGFTKGNVQLLCAGLCRLMRAQGVGDRGVVIGYDRRFLSLEASRWAAEVFAGCGVPCERIDREAPTPLVMFAVQSHDKPYGLAITASHNPAVYNGVKIFTAGGRDATREVTDALETAIAAAEAEPIPAMSYEKGVELGLIRAISSFNEYIDSILSLVDVEAIKKARLRVALDPMYGVSKTCLQTILLTARCEVDVIHERHDALFGGRLPAPNVDTLRALSTFVVENGLDLGIATDGDADRLGVIDDQGCFLHPNKLLVLLYYYLLEYRGWRGPCVRNNSTTHLLDRVAEGYGQFCREVPVGFKHVSAGMAETGAIIGGESSGGLSVRGHIHGKDGIYAAALLCEMSAKTGRKLSGLYREITDRFGEVFCVDADWRMTSERKTEIMERVFTRGERPDFPFPTARVSYEDGCKVYFENGGWVICRFSGTEPLLRAVAEMADEVSALQCVALWREFLSL
ncbi:MAG: phosphoglucomutase/phosphomannomutase family protein [Clostridia bacterium]|nr:phosphoglucomutase/phosphomannomutase family protein [Clostridia bacterium]